MFNHPDLTNEFIKYNEGHPERQQLCIEVAKPGYEVLAMASSPRFIKSHFPFSLLPNIFDSGCKVIIASDFRGVESLIV